MKKSRLLTHKLRAVALTGSAVSIFFASVTLSPGTAVCETVKKVKLRQNSYYYSAFNRRDPFRSLIAGQFVRDEVMDPVSLSAVELVGIVKGDLERIALLEDEKGFSYILRVGDRVRNGTVVSIGDQSMVARVTNFGQTSKFTLHLAQRHEGVKR